MPLATFTILGSVDAYDGASSNANTWNATLNCTATGFNIIPIFIVIICVFVVIGFAATYKGFS